MNDTRKEIIELIGDYMDKDLSDGCYFKKILSDKRKKATYLKLDYSYIQKKGYAYPRHFCYFHIKPSQIYQINSDGLAHYNNEYYKNIGHYDITAVLKYIIDKGGHILNNPNSFDIHSRDIKIHYGFIYNKPLHLYTEQEEKELLELLNNITCQS